MNTARYAALLLCCLFPAQGFAGTITFLTSPLSSSVDSVTWAQLGSDQAAVPKNFSAISALNLTISGTLGGSAGFTSVVCAAVHPVNCSYGAQLGGYISGDTLIFAEGTNNAGSGPVTLTYAPQFGIGAFIQSTSAGAFSASLAVYSGATLLATHAYGSDNAGDPVFLGAFDSSKEITRAVFSTTSCGSFACDPTDMSMDTLRIYDLSSIPEPGTFWLAGALAVLGYFQICKQKRNLA